MSPSRTVSELRACVLMTVWASKAIITALRIAHQLLHVERRRIEEQLAGLPQEERLRVHPRPSGASANSASTAGFVASRTQSSRRNTVTAG